MVGCTPIATEYRKEGFDFTQRGFASLPDSPDLYEEVVMDNVRVVIVGSPDKFPWERAKRPESHILGYAEGKNTIYILGKRVGDKIVVNQVVLGHELNHLLNFHQDKIANPDQMDRIEYCAEAGAKTCVLDLKSQIRENGG